MALFKGSSGRLSIQVGELAEEKYLAHITSWSIDSSSDMDETAYLGRSKTEDGIREKVPGTIGWSANIEGAVDGDIDANQDTLFDAHIAQTLINCMFYHSESRGYTGEAYIESFSITHAADGKAEFSASLSGNGKIERVDAT
jgi:predicted secreted protein